ncbi:MULTISPECIES: hypothetical protein [Sandaracinus]|nr:MULTISPECIES: hypothetical protein [Sandaracinus]
MIGATVELAAEGEGMVVLRGSLARDLDRGIFSSDATLEVIFD